MALGSRARHGHTRMEREQHEVVFDASGVSFCAGPCISKQPERDPIHVAGAKRYSFKPFSGGRYARFCYPVDARTTLVITNLRVCPSCNKRYLENWDEHEHETLARDARVLCIKLGIDSGVFELDSVPAAASRLPSRGPAGPEHQPEHQPEHAALD